MRQRGDYSRFRWALNQHVRDIPYEEVIHAVAAIFAHQARLSPTVMHYGRGKGRGRSGTGDDWMIDVVVVP